MPRLDTVAPLIVVVPEMLSVSSASVAPTDPPNTALPLIARSRAAPVLLSVDPASLPDSQMTADHPIAWCHDYDGGRAWYTALGHTDESWAEPA